MAKPVVLAAVAAILQSLPSLAQTTAAAGPCPMVLTPSYGAPVVGAGWTAQLVAKDLVTPRGIMFDQYGALLVVQQAKGIKRIMFTDGGGTCLSVKETTTLIDSSDLNHGIELSADGKTLYASSSDAVYAWAYDGQAGSVSGEKRTLVQNMSNSDHTSRTLLLPKKADGMLLVSRGSSDNMDMEAQKKESGRSQIKAFDINNLPDGKPYDYPSQGKLIGWGLRNSVGVAEEPATGGIFSVENSADNIWRSGQDIHQDDPGEELNFHGFMNGSTENQGGNYGYPDCFALWGTNIPDGGNMKVGDQFVLNSSDTLNDEKCARDYVAPRITFQAHTAPLDIKFTQDGKEAYVSFHGSWNRQEPVGYKLSTIAFDNGQPVEPPESTKAVVDILSNPDLSKCPDNCFRPVGLAIDAKGRLFMSSDKTGEIYVLQKADMSALGGSPTGSGGGGTLVTSTSTSTPNIAIRSGRSRPGENGLWMAAAAVALSLVGGAMIVAA